MATHSNQSPDDPRASIAWTGPMPEPTIPSLNAYAPASTFATEAASTVSLGQTELSMPDAAHYVRPNAYATSYDAVTTVETNYIDGSEVGKAEDTTVVVVPAPAQIAEHTGGNGLAAPLSPDDPHFQGAGSADGKLNNSGPTNGSGIPPAPIARRAPNWIIFGIRSAQLVFSIATLGFLAGASSYSGKDSPFSGHTAVDLYYAVSSISCAVSLSLVCFMLFRWIKPGKDIGQYTIFLIDLIMTCIWGADVFIIIGTQKCHIGSLNGWCDFFNTSIFFGVMAFLSYCVAMGWDVFTSCCGGNRGRLSEDLRGKRWRR
ncbi:hypothetical protein BDF19DRAFT_448256 [Syncephalis fuscata]|nr:hypothetical protein BDF19DRAFT_448256 [Syncephalis fuscata]